MLSPEGNEILTRVGRGTPMGELFRRFWLPALLTRELTVDGTPVRLRILGEDLVAFRDSNGRVGIVGAHCPHKGAPLFFGRNEECGLRCVYHGWKFDVDGQCVDLPNVPDARDNARLKQSMAIAAYPTREAGTVIWIYMGAADRIPAFPALEWTETPDSHVYVSRWLQRSNWAQGMEGEIDSSHISYLHRTNDAPNPRLTTGLMEDRSPILTLRDTDCGFVYGSRRNYSGQFYWRVTQWLAPMYSCIPGAPNGPFRGSGRAWVPIDDYNTTTFGFAYHVEHEMTKEEIAELETGWFFPPRIQPGVFELPHGYRIDTFLPTANKDNDYLIDRTMQKTVNFTGIWGVNEQDRALQESTPSVPGGVGIADRSREHLVSSDLSVVTARRKLIRMALDLQEGKDPYPSSHGEGYAVRAISKFSPIADFDELMREHAAEGRAATWPRQKSAAE
jgi:phenylpropionate dioxygenase-like ring-hydroxylating dioxygenase large terminal subunit